MMSEYLRVCRVCGLEAWTEEDLEQFKKDKGSRYGRDTICKKCFNEQQRLNKRKGGKYHEKQMATHRKWVKENPDKVNQKAHRYYNRHKDKMEFKERCRSYNRKTRIFVIEKMGGKCVKCGFSDWRALQIDHINGGGKKEIETKWKSSHKLYRYIRDAPIEEIKKEYQLLCANCNCIKRYEPKENFIRRRNKT